MFSEGYNQSSQFMKGTGCYRHEWVTHRYACDLGVIGDLTEHKTELKPKVGARHKWKHLGSSIINQTI